MKTREEILAEIERTKTSKLRDYGDFRDCNYELHRVNALNWVLETTVDETKKRTD